MPVVNLLLDKVALNMVSSNTICQLIKAWLDHQSLNKSTDITTSSDSMSILFRLDYLGKEVGLS